MAPKLVQLVEAIPDCTYSGVDVCEGAAVISEYDSKVLGFVVVWHEGVVCEVDGGCGVHLHVDTFAFVEVEVVEFGNLFNQLEGLLDCGWVLAYQNSVICVGKIK